MSLAEPGVSGLAWSGDLPLPLIAALLVAVPVFVQAPWVRVAPMAAALFTLPLAALGVVLEQRASGRLRSLGVLLVGFAGSWLGGSLFWGWCRLHPLWHLPIEAFALPIALAGLRSRWRLAAGFYLTSLDGTGARLYPLSVWEAIEARLDKVPSTNPAKRRFLEVTAYYGSEVEPDVQGRFVIPPVLREGRRHVSMWMSVSAPRFVHMDTVRPMVTWRAVHVRLA
jgi:hypothetical protein